MRTNEQLMEHILTYNKTDAQQRSTGAMDFRTPAKALIDTELSFQEKAIAIREDAADCAHKLNFLLIAHKASSPEGIHRANACAAHHIASAIGFHCHGETLETIGERMGKKKQVIDRYHKRFTGWSAANCVSLVRTYSPEAIIELCKREITQDRPLSDILDEFRQQLTDLFHELLFAAEQKNTEVYLNTSHFTKSTPHQIDIYALLKTH